MPESIHEKLLQNLNSAEALYHRLVLLVGKSRTGKTAILQNVANTIGTEVINVNLMLSARLLELTPRKRILRVPEIFAEIVKTAPSPVLLDNLEMLFEKELRQDPLRLLLGISRNHLIAAAWNGAAVGGKLIYAEPGHPEYRRYDTIDPLIVNMDGNTIVDAAVTKQR